MALVIFQDLAAPALGGSESDEVVPVQRRAVVAIGREHDGGSREEPRPAAIPAGEGVGGGLDRGGHGVTFKTCLTPRCAQRKPRLLYRLAGVYP